MTLDIAFRLDLAHGVCVGVRLPSELPEDALAQVAPEERAFALTLSPLRRRGYVGGRVAMRAALAELSSSEAPVLTDDRGAPIVPPGFVGSISHKETIAVALAAREGAGARVGVDVENDRPRRSDIARHVLRPEERAELDGLDEEPRARELLVRFSAKEAIYKAVDPFVRRYVAFSEAYVAPSGDGSAVARLFLRADEPRFAVDVRWVRRDGLVLTTARVSKE